MIIKKMTIHPFSQACQNNQQPILQVLKKYLSKTHNSELNNHVQLLEIGSGTGQHAACFSSEFPWLKWQTSDLPENHIGIRNWIEYSQQSNIQQPIALDVQDIWNLGSYDAFYSSNTAHIMSWREVELFFEKTRVHLKAGGLFFLYGPFKYNGAFTSESNAAFDKKIKSDVSHRGIRDFESICQLAEKSQLSLIEDCEMPANNRLLVFKK